MKDFLLGTPEVKKDLEKAGIKYTEKQGIVYYNIPEMPGNS